MPMLVKVQCYFYDLLSVGRSLRTVLKYFFISMANNARMISFAGRSVTRFADEAMLYSKPTFDTCGHM